MSYNPTIGLEIHAELATQSKMFCSCKNDSEEKDPNINICPVCTGHPGTLPVPNKEAIQHTMKVGLALHCQIAENSKFDRKNYFYPDLPKGYQISQFDMPFCEKGYLNIDKKKIGVTRVHLEEDTGRLTHPAKADHSLVDFNRAGVPLMELVTEPDITTAKEARLFGQELQRILRYLEASEANMEKGQMRVEANISIRKKGEKGLGTKVEVKNLNSFRAVEQAIEYETKRQEEVLESGERVLQETRGWDEKKGETFSQREKEEAHDYRYFPEPDIPLMSFAKKEVEALSRELPELPDQKRERFLAEYGITTEHIEVLVSNKDLSEYFEQVVSELGSGIAKKKLQSLINLSANYLISDLRGLLQGTSVGDEDFHITGENFAELMKLIESKTVSSPAAKTILKEMYETGKDPSQIIDDQGLAQVSDRSEIENIAKSILENNESAAADYKKGKEQALKFLVGQMMAQTKGAIDPTTATTILKKLLS